MYKLIHKLLNICGDLEALLSPTYTLPRRGRLFYDYVRLRIKVSLNRWFHFKHEHFLSFDVVVPDYEIFFAIFRQIFVRNVYYFETKTSAPAIVDCGGNMGMSVLYWKYLYPSSRITVFEPSREVTAVLEENLRLNKIKDIKVVHAAVNATEGKMKMHIRGNAACGNTLEYSIAEATPHKVPIESYLVDTVRLSSFISETIDMLKIDIEGSEGVVLKELVDANKFSYIKECVLEFHYYPKSVNNNLADILSLFRTQEFETQFYLEESDSHTPFGLIRHGLYPISMHAIRS